MDEGKIKASRLRWLEERHPRMITPLSGSIADLEFDDPDLMYDVLRIRLRKIVEMALDSPHPKRELEGRMLREERILYRYLCSVFEDYDKLLRGMIK